MSLDSTYNTHPHSGCEPAALWACALWWEAAGNQIGDGRRSAAGRSCRPPSLASGRLGADSCWCLSAGCTLTPGSSLCRLLFDKETGQPASANCLQVWKFKMKGNIWSETGLTWPDLGSSCSCSKHTKSTTLIYYHFVFTFGSWGWWEWISLCPAVVLKLPNLQTCV